MADESLNVPPVACLVWVRTRGQISAEKWSADTTAGSKAEKLVVAYHELSLSEFGLPIAHLVKRYPAPVEGATP